MSVPRYKLQYDRASYIRCLTKQKWNAAVNPRKYRSDEARLGRINHWQETVEKLSREEIAAKVARWRNDLPAGIITRDELLEEGFAILREAARRTIGLVLYDEQILGGLALARGGIAEMATGEGKTLTVLLPAFLYALSGRGVHVMTVNAYLAERDYEYCRPVFEFLGLSIAFLPEGGGNAEKREAYSKDITYGVGYEFGFDYMRDQLALVRHPYSGPGEDLRYALLGIEKPGPDVCQGPLAYAIIDEVDSVLIDEAGTPLLISEAARRDKDHEIPFLHACQQARNMEEGLDFELDLNRRSVELTVHGRKMIYDPDQNRKVPWDALRRPWETYIVNALKAEHLFEKDIQYVVEDDQVIIVDEFTGRKFADRTWREGQHQAVEAKEDVAVNPESDSAASITRQRYFSLYDEICGLTGTAAESAGEFWRFFKMTVDTIPLHSPSRRTIFPERVFANREAMHRAAVDDLMKRHARSQPVLVGTRTIRESEDISKLLKEHGVEHLVLTAKQDREEEEIIAQAGQPGRVTIATNMAGRGTDIGLADLSKEAGGLHVICIERNESSRIDRQLVGRGARNGEPGSAQSFVSAEDYLIRTHGPEAEAILKGAPADENGEIASRFSRVFDQIQTKAERLRYGQRVRMAEHDKWMEETKESLAT